MIFQFENSICELQNSENNHFSSQETEKIPNQGEQISVTTEIKSLYFQEFKYF